MNRGQQGQDFIIRMGVGGGLGYYASTPTYATNPRQIIYPLNHKEYIISMGSVA